MESVRKAGFWHGERPRRLRRPARHATSAGEQLVNFAAIASARDRRQMFKNPSDIAGGIARFGRLAALCLLALSALPAGAPAQTKAPVAAADVPMFWDPQRRMERPDTSALRALRFITDDEYPPFGFTTPEGALSGFNVDLARAICDELRVACTIQARRFETIFDTLDKNEGDAAIASIAMTPRNRLRADFTQAYYRTPARFITRASVALDDPRPETLAGKAIGVQGRTAHEAFLRKFFPKSDIRTYESPAALRSALKREEIDIAFGDGVSLALWLNGLDAAGCCAFRGGPYLESSYFGEGVGIAVRKDNAALRRALDFALARLSERGVYTELYLKYFPIGFF
jgi:polar amino acid transport system substrate-binding protein